MHVEYCKMFVYTLDYGLLVLTYVLYHIWRCVFLSISITLYANYYTLRLKVVVINISMVTTKITIRRYSPRG